MEVALSRVCGPGDIVTTLGERLGEEVLRRDEGGYGPAECYKSFWQHRGYREWRRLLLRGQPAQLIRNHATAEEVRAFVGEGVWNTYFKVTIERNPWDRAVSRYWWQQYHLKRRGRTPFADVGECLAYLARERSHWLTNWGHYAIEDTIAVDRVMFYETLEQDLAQLQRDLDIDGNLSLPARRAKAGYRPKGLHYREILGEKERSLIDALCAREIETFGYRF